MTSMFPALLLLLTPEAPTFTQAPVEATADPEYVACVERVDADTDDGRAAAMRWASEGGGAAAQHCLAVADLAAGFPKLAAVRLEELALRSDAGDGYVRARILSQAALAWVEAELPETALKAVEKAFALAPEASDLYLPAAAVYAANEKRQATIDAVTSAEENGQTSAYGYVLRGRARLALGDQLGAAEDVVAALRIDPFHLDALVLRGELIQAGVDIKASYQRAPGGAH